MNESIFLAVFGLQSSSDPITIGREANNSLSILSNAMELGGEEVVVLIMHDESGNSLKRKVVSMYLAGYNIMHLKSKR